MTECERIINDGVLPESFFIPETICDFYVDEARKKIWAVIVDLLIQFDGVCRRYNLKYWVAFGGLLGIVRHHGFIPWDDDLDVCMPREDYQELLKHSDEFHNPYFLQIPIEDDGYYYSFAKLRNSNTSAISLAFKYQNFNQGCFLDIFPLDNCVFSDLTSNSERIKEFLIINSTNMKRSNPFLSEVEIERFKKCPFMDPFYVNSQVDSISRKHNNEDTEYCSCSVITFYPAEKMCWKKSDIYPTLEVPFYGHKVFIPRNASEVLTTTYNNYMKFPPVETRGTWHGGAFFDPDTPYSESILRFRLEDKRNNQKSEIID